MAIRKPTGGLVPNLKTDEAGPISPSKSGKSGMVRGRAGPQPRNLVDNQPYSWNAVRGKSLGQRRSERLDDTTRWLDSKGLLTKQDKQWLANLGDEDKAKLTRMLRVNKWFGGGVRSSEDRNKIRAQVVLMAARSKDLGQTSLLRQRLTATYAHTKERLYESLDPQTFFDPREVSARSDKLAFQSLLMSACVSESLRADIGGSNRPPLNRPNDVKGGVRSLMDRDLLDAQSSRRLQHVISRDTQKLNDLMDIDKRQVPDKADRQKIREAVLLRAAHFGPDEAKAFKKKLLDSETRVSVVTPKVSKKEVKQDKPLIKSSINSVHPQNAPPGTNPMNVGNPEDANIDLLDADRKLDLEFDMPGHKQLYPLGDAQDPDGAAREQWEAIGDPDFDPRTGISSHGRDPASVDQTIDKVIDHTLELNDLAKGDLADRREGAKTVLQGVNSLLPPNLSLQERSQALADAAAIFLQPTETKNDGAPVFGNLDRALQNWPKRKLQMMNVEFDDETKHLEDAGFLRRELHFSAALPPIGRTFIFSPPIRDLIDEDPTGRPAQIRAPMGATVDAVLGNAFDGPARDEALRYTQQQESFADNEAVFRSTCLEKMKGDDAAEVQQILEPLQKLGRKIAVANPDSLAAPDGGRRGPNDPKIDSRSQARPDLGRTVSYDPKAPIRDVPGRRAEPDSEPGMSPHNAMLGTIVMCTFVDEYERILQGKVDNGDATVDEIQNGTAKETVKAALREAVDKTLEYCGGIQNATRDAAQGWLKAHRKHPSKLGTVANVEAGRFKGRMSAKQLKELNERWKDDFANNPDVGVKAPPVDRKDSNAVIEEEKP